MAWRGEPQRLLRNGQQLITKLFRYRCEPEPYDPEVGTIARYARGSDYHVQLKSAMQAFGESLRAQYGPKLRFRAVTDSAPVLERHLAWQQGGGWWWCARLLLEHAFLVRERQPGVGELRLAPLGGDQVGGELLHL